MKRPKLLSYWQTIPPLSKTHIIIMTTSSKAGEITLEATDMLRLIGAHLTECGLTQAARALREESGVGAAGCTRAVHSNLKAWALRGEWGNILESLATLDKTRCQKVMAPSLTNSITTSNSSSLELLMAEVHEMTILELAEAGDIRLAFATLRVVEDDLDKIPADISSLSSPTADGANANTRKAAKTNEYNLSKKRDLEQRLAALVSLRSLAADAGEAPAKDAPVKLPPSYYGTQTSKQERREDLGKRLTEAIPVVPPSRLPSLLQQAIKWQAYTGELPRIKNHWDEDEALVSNTNDTKDGEKNDKRSIKKRKRRVFDLVLGDVEIDPVNVGEMPMEDAAPLDPIPSKPLTTIKFGKKATAESAIFSPDVDSSGVPSMTSFSLVTGSSDGLVELYDAHNKYATLRMDLPYQEKDELMGHDDSSVLALAASKDGTMLATGDNFGEVKVWSIATGKCLRTISAHDRSAISCVSFSPDGSHVLTGSQDSNCREFGLRTTRMLKEFHGHSSYIHSCQYVLRNGGHHLCVVTSSADGTVRTWNAKTSEVMRVFRPVSLGDSLTPVGASLVVDHRSDLTSAAGGSPAVHSVLLLHTPADSMIIVPRGLRAFLVNFHGTVLRTFENDASTGGKVFVAATVSPSNNWLYCVTEGGDCCCFDIVTGRLEKTLRSFADETISKSKDGSTTAEITTLIHHPHKGVLAAFSNDKGQKKGQLVLWK